MPRIFIVVLLLLSFSARAQNDKKTHPDYQVKIKIPSGWIEKIRHYNYKQNEAAPLLRELEGYMKPDSLYIPEYNTQVDKGKGGLLNPIFADVDDEPGGELICLLGWDENYPAMGVFKQIRGAWYLIYLEDFYMFYSMPDLYVANTFSKNKTFYFRRVYVRGSGIYADGYSLYKLVNNKVYHSLELVNDAHIDLWGLPLNQAVRTNFRFSGGNTDDISVDYDYGFSLGGIDECDSDSFCEPLPFLNGQKGTLYRWDNKQHIYKLVIMANLPPTEYLDEKKISCFGAFGADSLFVYAFRYEIDGVLKAGTPRQKRLLKKFVMSVKSKK